MAYNPHMQQSDWTLINQSNLYICKLQVAGRRLQATSHFLNEEAEHDNELGHFPDTDDKPAKSISGHLE
jgi:hypothetical protein